MKTRLFLLCLFASSNLLADGDLPQAPQSVIDSARESCMEYAKEDRVPKEEIDGYLLECVNDELEEKGFKKIEYLD